MQLTLPELSLVLLIGASGSGKSTFARAHFKPTEIVSSDFCRGLVSDDENDQGATKDAFDVLHYIVGKRLAVGRLTVVDATSVQPMARKSLIELARQHHCLPVAIVLNVPEALCQERNSRRPDRDFGPQVVRRQTADLRRSLPRLRAEGLTAVHVLHTPEEIESTTIVREPLWANRSGEHGPFDVIGDVHGCFEELQELLLTLGYDVTVDESGEDRRYHVHNSAGRQLVFVGDLVDRGPGIVETLRLAMDAVADGAALCVPGNHENKLLRKLRGHNVQITHGLAESLAQLDGESPVFRDRVAHFIDSLLVHLVLDDGQLVVAHAGLPERMHGRASARVRDFALYGETTGETDEWGLPVRGNWAADYRGKAIVVYGHTPVAEPEWLNHTINVDSGCVFGGRLTALRYPERELISVPAARVYYESVRPFEAPIQPSEPRSGDLLDVQDVLGRRTISTRLMRGVTIREENAIAALEAMSRFAVDPRWLIHLPPTMSPSETSHQPGLLEHPAEAFAYYRGQGVAEVVCEEKHMGSRAVVVVCRDDATAARRFGMRGDGIGICYTRTGRRFFVDRALEAAFLERIRTAMEASGLWTQLGTDWICLDCELMPWSVKAQALLREQYAAVGAAGLAAYTAATASLAQAVAREMEVHQLAERYGRRAQDMERYAAAYRPYCWPVASLDDLKLAPFHILASEGAVHVDHPHSWHLERIGELCAADDVLLLRTPVKLVDLSDEASEAEATSWWEALTGRGGEGMVVKPREYVAVGPRGLAQPAVKCRGAEYLRIIYGPDYAEPENLERLRRRGLATKRSLALREFALGVEALERFVQREPLYRVHECVFGVLALESEPVDPRL
ncbi:MAG: hypothetical protein QOF51_3245 [Chloroflexota bacterium]|nr:hypothetical protein [Chloroflexota bacterium]